MNPKEFDPDKFIDREFELGLFQELLTFNDTARILAIKDGSGTGKSQLLKKLEHYCRTIKPRIPVSLIACDQLGDRSPLFLTRKIFEHLSSVVSFDSYSSLDKARISGDFNAFGALSKIEGSVHLRDVDFLGAIKPKIAGVIHETEIAVANIFATTASLSEDQEKLAQEEVIDAFFRDLKGHCSNRPVVLMFDSYEKGGEILATWFEEFLLERHFFSGGPSKLLLVLAGQESPRFHALWPKEDCDLLVKSVDRLGRWTKEHVEQCLRVNGFKYESDHVELLHKFIETLNAPPSDVVNIMQVYIHKKESAQ